MVEYDRPVLQLMWPKETGRPRWGCATHSWIMAPYIFAGLFPAHPSHDEVDDIYDEAMKTPSIWTRGKNVIEVDDVGNNYRVDCWSPSALMQIACNHAGPGLR
ncbi:hypothetical protein LCGC14_2398590, partial [marine sediment metagenome]